MTARLVLLLLALVLAAPAVAAQDPPEELWRAYPLDPALAPPGASSAPTPPPRLTPPFRQPDPQETVVGAVLTAGDDGGLQPWWIVVAVALVAAPVAVFAVRRRLEAIPARAAVDAWTREPRPATHSPGLRRFARAADDARALASAPVECVVRREGVVRSRFVAEVEPRAGRQRTIASSRSFRRRGHGMDVREADARRAWDDLLEGLQADGWELAPAWGAQEGDVVPQEPGDDEVRLIRMPRLAAVEHAESRASGA